AFDPVVEEEFRTVRAVRRFVNAVEFVVPSLSREVNVVDLILLELMRVLYPELYLRVRQSKHVLAGRSWGALEPESAKRELNEALDEGRRSLSGIRRRGAEMLLSALFPRVSIAVQGRGDVSEGKLAHERRVASLEYFDRFFLYGVAGGDVSDAELAGFVDAVESLSGAMEGIAQFLDRADPGLVVQKLRRLVSKLDSRVASQLALAVASLGGRFPG